MTTPLSREAFLAEARRLGLDIPDSRAEEMHGAYAKLMGWTARLRAGLAPADDLALRLDREPR